MVISEPTIVTLIAEDSMGHEQTCSFEVTIQGGFSAEVDAGEDVTISQGDAHQLSAFAASEGEFHWSPEDFLDNPVVSDPITTPQASITYTVEFVSENGCMASDEVTITVRGISITKGFSPDNDGVNDTWIILGIDQFPNNEVLIFNRRGNLVYEVNGYDNTETVFKGVGNINNETLSEGTYFYSINLSDNESPIQGFIVLKK